MTAVVKTSRHGDVFSISIDRPDEGNQLTLSMVRDLASAFRSAADSDAKVVTLRSAGSDFCLGRDTRGGSASSAGPVTALGVRENVIAPLLDVYEAIASVPQPVVCSVQGRAAGFGCALAAACDVTIAAENARFSLPELEKNLPPTLAISAMMSRVPRKSLTWMVYSTKVVDAQMAAQIGIASQVVAEGALTKELESFVEDLCTRSREALIAIKDYFRSSAGLQGRSATDLAGNLLATVLSSVKRD
jgi:enoyl-CoA hydratase/carnithine racemase